MPRPSTERGFTMLDMIVVVAIIGILSAMAIPTITNAVDGMRLTQSARELERELQQAKARAVSKTRVMRVRLNCPATGQYRITELIGTPAIPAAADAASDRCDMTKYPYPAADANPLTLPNHDGPVQRLDSSVSFTVVPTIEFWPDGTAHYNTGATGAWPMIPTTGVNIRLARNGKTATLTVNGLGKITSAIQ